MNIVLIQRSVRLPALLDQAPAGQRCARDCWRHRDRASDTVRTSFIDADGVTDSWFGGTLTTGFEQYARPAWLESP